jgi:hypothetical protein
MGNFNDKSDGHSLMANFPEEDSKATTKPFAYIKKGMPEIPAHPMNVTVILVHPKSENEQKGAIEPSHPKKKAEINFDTLAATPQVKDEPKIDLDQLAQPMAQAIRGEVTAEELSEILKGKGLVIGVEGKEGIRDLFTDEQIELWGLVGKHLGGDRLALSQEQILERSLNVREVVQPTPASVQNLPDRIVVADADNTPAFDEKMSEARALLEKGIKNIRLDVNRRDELKVPGDLAPYVWVRNDEASPADIVSADWLVRHIRQTEKLYGSSVLVIPDDPTALKNLKGYIGDIQVVRYSDLLNKTPRILPLSVLLAIYTIAAEHA